MGFGWERPAQGTKTSADVPGSARVSSRLSDKPRSRKAMATVVATRSKEQIVVTRFRIAQPIGPVRPPRKGGIRPETQEEGKRRVSRCQGFRVSGKAGAGAGEADLRNEDSGPPPGQRLARAAFPFGVPPSGGEWGTPGGGAGPAFALSLRDKRGLTRITNQYLG